MFAHLIPPFIGCTSLLFRPKKNNILLAGHVKPPSALKKISDRVILQDVEIFFVFFLIAAMLQDVEASFLFWLLLKLHLCSMSLCNGMKLTVKLCFWWWLVSDFSGMPLSQYICTGDLLAAIQLEFYVRGYWMMSALWKHISIAKFQLVFRGFSAWRSCGNQVSSPAAYHYY